MLAWVLNLGFAGGTATVDTDGVSFLLGEVRIQPALLGQVTIDPAQEGEIDIGPAMRGTVDWDG